MGGKGSRYTAEEKANALLLCKETSFLHASEETGISVFTLYKWRAAEEGRTSVPPEEADGYQITEEAETGQIHEDNGAANKHKKTADADSETQFEETAKAQNKLQADKESESADIVDRLKRTPVEEAAAEKETSQPCLSNDHTDECIIEERIRLRLENAALKEQAALLKSALRAFAEQ